MVFVVEYVIIVFRSLKRATLILYLALQLGLTAAFRPYLLLVEFVCCAANLCVVVILFADHRDHVISSSYVNNTMSPNIESGVLQASEG